MDLPTTARSTPLDVDGDISSFLKFQYSFSVITFFQSSDGLYHKQYSNGVGDAIRKWVQFRVLFHLKK